MAWGKDRKHVPQTDEEIRHHPSNLWNKIEGPSDFLYRLWINRTFRKLIPGVVLFIILLALPNPDGLSWEGQKALALFVFIV